MKQTRNSVVEGAPELFATNRRKPRKLWHIGHPGLQAMRPRPPAAVGASMYPAGRGFSVPTRAEDLELMALMDRGRPPSTAPGR